MTLRRARAAICAGLALALVPLAAGAAQARSDRPEGPWPPSSVLARNPADVPPPAGTARAAAAAAASCPTPAPGAHSVAPGSGKTVALTFDDGPGASTDQVIAILEDAGVAATFFNIGINASAQPGDVRAEATQRFLVGNHTWSHPDLKTLDATQQASEIDRASAEQTQLLGSPPCFFRPPYGNYNSTTLSLAQARDLSVWIWSVDTEDWKAEGSGSSFWINRIIGLGEQGGSQTHPVVLMHNQPRAMPATVAALPTLINFYRDHGYRFVDLTGRTADRYVTGDWDGNGSSTPGIVRGNVWYLRNSNSAGSADVTFAYGSATDRPVTGDWDGNGSVTPGVVRGNTWYLRNSDSAGPADVVLSFGSADDRPVTGDWDGNGTTTPGVVRGNAWYERATNTPSDPAATALAFGLSTDRIVTGDWDGNGTTTPGVIRGNTWYERATNVANIATAAALGYAGPTDRVLTGDWDGNGTTTPGVARGSTWFLRESNTSGVADRTFAFEP
jgi:peptidoglycan-N-acetylglucosamine deacetylase